jgi:MoaA/NifB/PqqE/SkfB family radical SAM enzyme
MTSSTDPRERNTEAVRAAELAGLGSYDAYPTRVTLEITAACNLRCPHCEFTPARAWIDKNDPQRILYMGLDELRRFADAVFPHIQEVVPSVVGEPMMYPYWNEFLDLCSSYGVVLEIYTNGTYLDEASIARLAPVTGKLIVSMDGASRDTFNLLRKPCDFDDICARLELVKRYRTAAPDHERFRQQIHGVLTLHWVDELVEMVRLAHRYAVDELSIAHLVAYNDLWRGYHPSLEPERTDRNLRAASEEARHLGVSVTLPRLFGTGENVSHRAAPRFPIRDKIRVLPQPENRKYWCKYLWREVFIALDGTVAPCCGLGRPEVDNLRKNPDLKRVFAHPVLAGMREGMVKGDLHPACAKCPQLSMYGELDYQSADFNSTYHSLDAALAEQRAKKNQPAP